MNVDEKLILEEIYKIFKIDKNKQTFKSIKEIKSAYNIDDKTLNLLIQVIENRIDPIQWIKNNIKIQHPKSGTLPFNIYDFQANVLKVWLAKHFIITLKSRQVGMSTLAQGVCLWLALNYSNYHILILSAKDRNAMDFLEKIKTMYNNLPNNPLKLQTITSNAHALEFINGSKIFALPATPDSARGLSINLLIIDEAAFIENIDVVYQSTYPVISRAFPSKDDPNQKPFGVMVISTPFGVSGTGKWYFDMYESALQKINQFYPLRIHWSEVPEFDDNWYLDQCEQLNWDYKKIASELDLSFVSSGNTFIPNAILDMIGTIPPIMKDMDGNLWIWENNNNNETYVIGVDVAYGDKNDSSTIQVIKASTLEQVAEYESNSIIVDDFADVVVNISKMYYNSIVNIERNAVGKTLIDKILKKYGESAINLYKDVNAGDIRNKPGQHQTPKDNIGTTLTKANRDLLLSNMYGIVLENYMEGLNNIISENSDDRKLARERFENIMKSKKQNSLSKKNGIIKSERLLTQLLGFVTDRNGKVQGKHDDIILSWVHALYCYTKNKMILRSQDVAKILNKSMEIDTRAQDMANMIKFMQSKNTTSSLWNKYSYKELVDIFKENMEEEEEIKRKEEINNQFNNDDINKNDKDIEANRAIEIFKQMYDL